MEAVVDGAVLKPYHRLLDRRLEASPTATKKAAVRDLGLRPPAALRIGVGRQEVLTQAADGRAEQRKVISASLLKEHEESVQKDLEKFWNWCPAPMDGLHRTALLVKLLDYAGLTSKLEKKPKRVERLDQELTRLCIMPTDLPQAHQRISREAFIGQSGRLREALLRHPKMKSLWDAHVKVRQLGGNVDVASFIGQGPLSLWVLCLVDDADEAAALAARP
eukprot:TRINITY_DN45537_c0_g1_i1.p1 TRINITY_DN45537_c0_g1~~TRINITY_DN45537_c0_g1_i1.p1  ORF type:complete len:220 (+),score=45.75 TRINITY_DN45537_c0_g1_i1:80-739(+)